MLVYQRRQVAIRLTGGAVCDQLYTEHQSHASHVADRLVLRLQLRQALEKPIPDGQAMLLDSIALDDFGTGYSSLSYLHQYPIDTLKIDQSFVSTVNEGNSACLVDAIVAMAQGLKMNIVAEGVENREQLAYLEALGCRYIQGWLFGKANSERDMVKLLHSTPLELEQRAVLALQDR